MSLTREDMLRELELLPVWRPRMAPSVAVLPVATEQPPVVEHVVEVVASGLPEVMVAETAIPTSLPVEQDTLPPEITETVAVEVASAPVIQAPWLLLCPQADDETSQQLLQNIVRALQLPSEEVKLHPQLLQAAQVQSRFCVLFGLDAANHFLGTHHTDISSVRGQLLTHGTMTYVITHHPHTMLAQSLLKKEVWHDLCLLLAEK